MSKKINAMFIIKRLIVLTIVIPIMVIASCVIIDYSYYPNSFKDFEVDVTSHEVINDCAFVENGVVWMKIKVYSTFEYNEIEYTEFDFITIKSTDYEDFKLYCYWNKEHDKFHSLAGETIFDYCFTPFLISGSIFTISTIMIVYVIVSFIGALRFKNEVKQNDLDKIDSNDVYKDYDDVFENYLNKK